MKPTRGQLLAAIRKGARDVLYTAGAQDSMKFIAQSLSKFEGNQHFLASLAVLESDPNIRDDEVLEFIEAIE